MYENGDKGGGGDYNIAQKLTSTDDTDRGARASDAVCLYCTYMLYSPSSSINRREGLAVELIDRKGYWRLGDTCYGFFGERGRWWWWCSEGGMCRGS